MFRLAYFEPPTYFWLIGEWPHLYRAEFKLEKVLQTHPLRANGLYQIKNSETGEVVRQVTNEATETVPNGLQRSNHQ